jgi:hypothetical protein
MVNVFINWHKAFPRSSKVRIKAKSFSKRDWEYADEPTSLA